MKQTHQNHPEKYIDDGWILNEAALVAAIEYKYTDAEVTYLKNFNEKSLQKNDVNFLVGINLLNAWHSSNTMHKKWLAIMKNNKNNIYPPLSEQNFLYNKGDYLKYYEKRGIPIAPTFLIKKNRDPKKIIAEVKKNKWKGFVVKPDYAFANIEISKYEMDDKDVEKKLSKYLKKTKKFPGLVCQEKMKGFIKKWELKTFWINGEYKYHVAIKASGDLWGESEQFGNVSKKSMTEIKKIAKKVLDNYPET